MIETKEKVLIVGVDLSKKEDDFEASMDELEALVDASGGEVVGRVTQKREGYHSATYIGKGKIDEVIQWIENYEVYTVIVNDELSGSQMRNLEAILECKVLDRTGLILDIFAQRATSKEGMLQVHLAQLKYRLPRLQGFYGALSRTGGGIGTRGPGEQQIDTDRRHIQRQILNIEKQLANVAVSRNTTRKKRLKSNLPVIAFVGYTNAGKSSIINALLNMRSNKDEVKEVFVKNMLFATLDASYRKVKLNNGLPVLLTDTVGFVSRLPHDLVAAFKSTLEEIEYADIIVHVIDASNPNKEIQFKTTESVLKTLEVSEASLITVFNKMDLVSDDYQTGIVSNSYNLNISSKSNYDIDLLLDVLEDMLSKFFVRKTMLIPFEKMRDFDELASTYTIESMIHQEDGVKFSLILSKDDARKFETYIIKDR